MSNEDNVFFDEEQDLLEKLCYGGICFVSCKLAAQFADYRLPTQETEIYRIYDDGVRIIIGNKLIRKSFADLQTPEPLLQNRHTNSAAFPSIALEGDSDCEYVDKLSVSLPFNKGYDGEMHTAECIIKLSTTNLLLHKGKETHHYELLKKVTLTTSFCDKEENFEFNIAGRRQFIETLDKIEQELSILTNAVLMCYRHFLELKKHNNKKEIFKPNLDKAYYLDLLSVYEKPDTPMKIAMGIQVNFPLKQHTFSIKAS